MPQQTGLYV